MKTTDDLFQLIKSLKQTEKRYFKIFASGHVIGEKNNYVKLFEVIDKQKNYNEELVRKQFAGKNFLKQLHVAKNYLYKLILKSLRNYHSDISADAELKNMLREVEILYEKALYKQCRKLLSKARKIAYSYEKYLQILEIISWEKKVIKAGFHSGKMEKNLEEVLIEEQSILDRLKNVFEYWSLDSRLNIQIEKEGLPRDESALEDYRKIIDTPLLSNEGKAISYQARLYYYSVFANYYYVKGDLENDFRYTKKLVELLESKPEKISEETSLYVEALHNFLIACIRMRNDKEFMGALKKLRAISERSGQRESQDLETRIFVFSYNLELRMYLTSGEFEKGIGLIKAIESGLLKFQGKINRVHEIVFYYNIAYLYTIAGQYNKALAWLGKILNAPDAEIRQDILSFSRMLNMVIHYELGNNDILEYIVKSTYRFLYPRRRLFRFETMVLGFIKKTPKMDSKQKVMQSFTDLKSEVESLLENPFEKKALEYFDLVSWLGSKISGKSFAEVIKNKSV